MYQIYTTTTTRATLHSILYHSEWAAINSALKLVEVADVKTFCVINLDTDEIVYEYKRA